jgi:tungstate transport system substrate-binding protein
MRPIRLALTVLAAAALLAAACSGDDDDTLIVATTTSLQDSGLLDALVNAFEQQTQFDVKAVAVGSGQAIEQASRGDADIVLAHSPAAELKMVADGDGIERTLVMHNDFIIVGPEDDPAGVRGASSAAEALRRVFDAGHTFVSRGDRSGTHVFELRLWGEAGADPRGHGWYAETGSGQGETMQVASQRRGYTLSDRGTFLAQRTNLELAVLFEGGDALINPYHAILVNPQRHEDVHAGAARAFLDFLVSGEAQDMIAMFGVEKFGQPLFVPDAGRSEPGG